MPHSCTCGEDEVRRPYRGDEESVARGREHGLVEGLAFRGLGSWFRVQGVRFRVQGLVFGVWSLEFGVWGLGFGF